MPPSAPLAKLPKTGSRFRIGQIVKLRSGGPKMVVMMLPTPDRAVCIWMTQRHEIQFYELPFLCLVSYGTQD